MAAGLAGATGFVVMVGTIADSATQVSTVDLVGIIDAQSAERALQLEGGALAGAAAVTPGVDPQPGQTSPSTPSSAPSEPSTGDSGSVPSSQRAPDATTTPTTAGQTTAAPTPESTTPASTNSTIPVTSPTTDTTSSAS